MLILMTARRGCSTAGACRRVACLDDSRTSCPCRFLKRRPRSLRAPLLKAGVWCHRRGGRAVLSAARNIFGRTGPAASAPCRGTHGSPGLETSATSSLIKKKHAPFEVRRLPSPRRPGHDLFVRLAQMASFRSSRARRCIDRRWRSARSAPPRIVARLVQNDPADADR